jgi:hypothetical protein
VRDEFLHPYNNWQNYGFVRVKSEVKFPIFHLEYKQVTEGNTCVRNRHICKLFLDVVATSVEALITAVDQSIKALVVK